MYQRLQMGGSRLPIVQRYPFADPMLLVARRHDHNDALPAIALDAEARRQTRRRLDLSTEESIFLQLPRGTVLQPGDSLLDDQGQARYRITAAAEPVYTVTAADELTLLRAAYHLGNRHVPLEVRRTYLRLSPDPVLRQMLEGLGLTVVEEEAPLLPEDGAYAGGHHHHG